MTVRGEGFAENIDLTEASIAAQDEGAALDAFGGSPASRARGRGA
jgi:hypothetical protein